jgi:hypothetical protein
MWAVFNVGGLKAKLNTMTKVKVMPIGQRAP